MPQRDKRPVNAFYARKKLPTPFRIFAIRAPPSSNPEICAEPNLQFRHYTLLRAKRVKNQTRFWHSQSIDAVHASGDVVDGMPFIRLVFLVYRVNFAKGLLDFVDRIRQATVADVSQRNRLKKAVNFIAYGLPKLIRKLTTACRQRIVYTYARLRLVNGPDDFVDRYLVPARTQQISPAGSTHAFNQTLALQACNKLFKIGERYLLSLGHFSQ